MGIEKSAEKTATAKTGKIDLKTAITFVIANMVGTGVFTSLGFQLVHIKNPLSIVILWAIGCILALFGAFAYSEISSVYPRSGGEYTFTKELYHPAIGFAAGWISIFVGFAAPVSLASIAFGTYLQCLFPFINTTAAAVTIILFVTVVHLNTLKISARFQYIFTFLKVITILLFIITGFIIGDSQKFNMNFTPQIWDDIKNPAFAVSLLYVSFAYSGWNASTYIAGEIKSPKKNIPLSLILGTLIVAALYICLNVVFMFTASANELTGKLEVAMISAQSIFGINGGKIMGGIISLLLISTISSMIFTGPRVISVMGEDFRKFRYLTARNKNGVPVIAIISQSLISIVFVLTSSFEQVITYIGFTLNIFTLLTVAGVFVLRFKNKNEIKYKTPGYPVTPIIFIAINLWFLYYVISSKPHESFIGLLFVLSGIAVYFLLNKKNVI